MDLIHSKGQYFTVDIILKQKVYEFILNKSNLTILEPSIGQGDLVTYVKNINSKIKFDMYEIDENIKLLSGINKNFQAWFGKYQKSVIKPFLMKADNHRNRYCQEPGAVYLIEYRL